MFKKICSVLIILCSLTFMCSCGENTMADTNKVEITENTETNQSDNSGDTKPTVRTESQTDENKQTSSYDTEALDGLEDSFIENIENNIEELESEYETLCSSISSYDAYVNNVESVEVFYDKILSSFYDMTAEAYEFGLIYAETVTNSDLDYDEMYDLIDGIYDCIYSDAGDALYDDIYSGLLDDMYDDFYNGVIADGYDTVPYADWSDVSHDAYRYWSDTSSDCYDYWSDMKSDIYDLWSDLRRAFFGDNLEKARKIVEDFREDVEKLNKN